MGQRAGRRTGRRAPGAGALRRLAAALSRWDDAAAALELALGEVSVDAVDVRGQLLAELASIYDGRLGDVERAIGAYRRLLDVDLGDAEAGRLATEGLARLLEEGQRWGELRDVLRRRLALAQRGGASGRRELLARAAELEEYALVDRGAPPHLARGAGRRPPTTPTPSRRSSGCTGRTRAGPT
ncbi:MAG: hypothetical protein R2939_14105 [Kofleriaceae bacterium]